jgi:hypothetical protein
MTDHVVIGRGTPTAVFRSVSREESDDPYASSSFVVELCSDGLNSTRSVFMLSLDWDALASLFSDLANGWRGWEGEKSWESIEHDLTITAVSDSLGHCLLTFTLRDGANYTWKTVVGGFKIDAGEDMAAVARDMRAWVDNA